METMRPGAADAATVHAERAGEQLRAAMTPGPVPLPTPATVGDEMLGTLLGQDPDSCPESLRYLAMTRGSQDTVHALVSELEHRLAHVLADEGPTDPWPPTPEPVTAAGRYAATAYDESTRLERRLRSLLGRIRGV